MKKNPQQLEKRRRIIKMLIECPEEGIRYIEQQLLTIRQEKLTYKRISAISELLFLSDQTILNDIWRK